MKLTESLAASGKNLTNTVPDQILTGDQHVTILNAKNISATSKIIIHTTKWEPKAVGL